MQTNTHTEAEYEQMMQEGEKVHQANVIISNNLTKGDIAPLAEMLVDNVLRSGDPLTVAANIKTMELIIEAVKGDKRFKDYALSELAKYGKKYTSPTGVTIEPMESAGRYDFKTCGDPVVIDLETKLKERQEFLKKLPHGGMDIVTDEGEVIKIFPPARPASTSTYKITIAK
jgi:hypothetical protein